MSRFSIAARCVMLAAVLAAAPASASLGGSSRVTLLGGWRLTPNDAFYAAAAQRGLVRSNGIGGPVLTGTFAYSAWEWFELGIDLFASGERFHFVGTNPYTTITYGGWLSARIQMDAGAIGPVQRLVPFVGAQAGPTLVFTSGGPQTTSQEVLMQGFAATAGVTGMLGAHGVTLEARYVFAAGSAVPVGTFNAGGLWFGLGFTWGIAAGGPNSSSMPL